MTRSMDTRGELVDLAASYRHLRAEHRAARPGGATRRRLDAEMRDVADRLERRLVGLGATAETIEEWRRHAYHDGPVPLLPAAGGPAPQGGAAPERPTGRWPWAR